MDIELLKTFLELTRTRHFGRTAENLYLTQSAVSARVRQLEDTLGAQLFTRTRNDIQLTPVGSRLVKYAESILNTWNRAQQDAALKAEDKESLAIGGMFTLWDVVLQNWLHRLYRQFPRVALQAETASQDVLVRKLLDGALDLAFMWEPPQMAELQAEEIGSIHLVMVSTEAGLSARDAVSRNYVVADWGTAFAIAHARHFPDIPPPAIRVALGRMSLAFLLGCGGNGYLAEPMAREHLESGRLHRVADAPVIDRAFFAVYLHAAAEPRRKLIGDVLAELRRSNAMDAPTPASAARGSGPDGS
jgi:DNA-binding transcriptional LysR family regulator